MSCYCFKVSPLSRKDIRALTRRFREALNWTEPYLPVIEVLEMALPELSPEFVYEICSKTELGDDHGLTYPDRRVIKIREDVYERACDDDGFSRFTIGHEIGHLYLHSDIPLARRVSEMEIKTYQSSEWQADCFAGELLVSAEHAHLCTSPEQIKEVFGVSKSAAITQWRALRRDHIV